MFFVVTVKNVESVVSTGCSRVLWVMCRRAAPNIRMRYLILSFSNVSRLKYVQGGESNHIHTIESRDKIINSANAATL